MVFLKLVDSPTKISQDINAALVQEINHMIKKNSNKVKNTLKNLIAQWIQDQPEVASVLSQGSPGSLNAQFGLPPGVGISAMNAVIHAVIKSINVNFTSLDKNFKGGIEFSIQPEDFQNLLSLGEGHIITERVTDLHWLNWLLTMGDTAIIIGYTYNPKSGIGRSGGGNMVDGGMWRVDPRYTGTKDNNFITRALSNREKELATVLIGLF